METDPLQYLNANRFDVAAKVLYAKHKRINAGLEYAKRIYTQHLRIMHNHDIREDSGEKHNIQDFINAFDTLIHSISTDGFNAKKSVVPVKNGNIMNGAHRTAICIDTQIKMSIANEKNAHYLITAEEFCKKDILSETYDSMLLEYIRRKTHTRIAVLFPMAFEQMDACMDYIKQNSQYLGHKDIPLSSHGVLNLLHILYEGETWLQVGNGVCAGVIQHLNHRWKKGKPIRLVFMDFADTMDIISKTTHIKQHIRNIFNKGNYPININDTYAETLSIATQVLHKNSLHMLDKVNTYKYAKTINMIRQIKHTLPPSYWEHFVIDSGGAISICGLRQTHDIDYLASDTINDLDTLEFCDRHDYKSAPYNIKIQEIIWNPKYHFYMFGLKFIDLGLLKHMKQNRNETKDKMDIIQIDAFLNNKKTHLKQNIQKASFYILLTFHILKGFARRIKRITKKKLKILCKN